MEVIAPQSSSTSPPRSRSETNLKSLHPFEDALMWVCASYEVAEGERLLRSSVYADYEAYCHQTGKTPIDRSVLGKLLRKAFPNLQMRRLGPRNGNHYYYLSLHRRGSGSSGDSSNPNSPSLVSTTFSTTTTASPPTLQLGHHPTLAPDPMSLDLQSVCFPTISLPPLNFLLQKIDNSDRAAVHFAQAYHHHCRLVANAFSELAFEAAAQHICSFWDTISAAAAELLERPKFVDQLIAFDELMFSALAVHLAEIIRVPHSTSYSMFVSLKNVTTNFDKVVMVSMRAAPYDYIAKRVAVVQRVFVEPLKKEYT